ncbi:hypothetical protein Cgig2_013026 [Carnegiea gigantea]|uniref:DUF569 domain-containing protein n=1 Tax=Carnegiea gigantea TaxID=171969 RepID=A0A9Q1GT12_9CARY|nr:hypothetical protein Cgig2_013026 [Carnegiea gigantea]
MDIFRNAKTVRLRSRHEKYLIANEDEETVIQKKNGLTRSSRWTVEIVDAANAIRLKSCFGKYLSASNQPFLLGLSGRKVLQALPRRLDSSLEWEPIKEGSQVRLQTRYGHFLRANSKLPPWRNSVTHDVPHRTSTQDWVLWDVDVVETGDTVVYSPPKPDGRLIHYRVADERGNIDESVEAKSFLFKGHDVVELTQKLEEETQLQDIFICTRSPLNGKLFPLRLQLPPNNQEMQIVVVPSKSKCMFILCPSSFSRNDFLELTYSLALRSSFLSDGLSQKV